MNKTVLPYAGQGRWWKIELAANDKRIYVQRRPLKVSLMEELIEGSRALSTVIGVGYAAARERDVTVVANAVLNAVGDYKEFVGEFYERD